MAPGQVQQAATAIGGEDCYNKAAGAGQAASCKSDMEDICSAHKQGQGECGPRACAAAACAA